MAYKVQLPVFEGPLDLLLYLIKKEEVNIYDIPIARITSQYLEHMEVMKLLDLEIAGEFILMAATLMHIKSKMLLPLEDKEESTLEEQVDPREELVKKLLEYRKFKEVAGELNQMRLKQRDSFTRLGQVQAAPLKESEEPCFEASLFDLITAFSKVLKKVPKEVFHQVIKDEFTVSDKIHQILHKLVRKPTIYFSELFKNAKNRGEVIAIFLALLELVKLKEVVVKQELTFGRIKLMRNPEWQKKR
ncbi:MAG: segregation/condensation protein A [Candidatus Omnitrophota bacterium]|nr:MAG: segregation/condensation protein A [Candidatus Omnitrophota bacterium]